MPMVIPQAVGRVLSRKVLALVVAGASSATIATTFVGEKEGLELAAYQDGAKVWTICRGHTATAKPGMTATPEHCDRLFASDLGRFLALADKLVTVPMSPARHAAVADFCYNVGEGNCTRSTFIRKLNANDPTACDEPLRWMYVAGRDCRDPANDCPGIVTRRQQEAALCRL